MVERDVLTSHQFVVNKPCRTEGGDILQVGPLVFSWFHAQFLKKKILRIQFEQIIKSVKFTKWWNFGQFF